MCRMVGSVSIGIASFSWHDRIMPDPQNTAQRIGISPYGFTMISINKIQHHHENGADKGRMFMKKTVIFTDEPYKACIDCSHRAATRCKGPRTSNMPLLEWCRFIKAIKEAAGYTNTEVAEGAEVSLSTVESIMSLNREKDILRDTARRIENFVLGVGTGYPCYLAFEENIPDVSQRVSNAMRDLERELDEKNLAALDNLRNSHAAEMLAINTANEADKDVIKAEADAKILYLRNQLERLQRDNDNLWAENMRKSKIIDRLLENRSV